MEEKIAKDVGANRRADRFITFIMDKNPVIFNRSYAELVFHETFRGVQWATKVLQECRWTKLR